MGCEIIQRKQNATQLYIPKHRVNMQWREQRKMNEIQTSVTDNCNHQV